MASGAQWFAIFSASTGDLVSSGSAVAFPLNSGLRAITIDGDPTGKSWDKAKLDFITGPPPPPSKVICDPTCDCRKGDHYPYAEEWVRGDLVFTGTNGASLAVRFTPGKFTDTPLIDGITVNSPKTTGNAYLAFSTGDITKDGLLLWAKAVAPINYTVPVVIHAIQRTKEKA